jgi:branched-chain amino acid transport system permease protein
MTEFLQQLLNGVFAGSQYAVVALGFALVFNVMRVLQMAHPALVMAGAYTAYWVLPRTHGNLLLAALAASAVAVALGLIIERTVIRPTRGRYFLIPFVATLGVSTAMQYGAQNIFGVDNVAVTSPFPGVTRFWGLTIGRNALAVFILAVAMALATHYYVRYTKWGLASRAVAERHTTAQALGINVNRVSQLTLGGAALLAGVAGVGIALAQGQVGPFLGTTYGTKSFIAMLIAGNRRIIGVMVVAVALGVLEALVAGYVSSTLRDAVAFGAMIVVLYLKPSGLFGSYEHE